MNAKQKLHQVHLQEWAIRFAVQKASGLTVRQWYEQNSLSFHTYNYWKHLLKEEVVDQSLPDIVPLSLPVLSGSDSSSGTTAPAFPSIRANRSIRSNNSIEVLDYILVSFLVFLPFYNPYFHVNPIVLHLKQRIPCSRSWTNAPIAVLCFLFYFFRLLEYPK